jgi:hypothetical protein
MNLTGEMALPRTSHHECGHALAALCLSIRVNEIILGDGSAKVLGVTNHRRPVDFRDGLLISVAGSVGESLGGYGDAYDLFVMHPGCRGDRTDFDRANSGNISRAEAIRRCRLMLSPHVALLRGLAQNLVELRRLDADQVESIVQSYESHFRRQVRLCT